MKEATIHARFVTSDFDETRSGDLLDDDVRLGTFRAYLCALRFLRDAMPEDKDLHWQEAKSKIRPVLPTIVRDYWVDQDFDDRMRSADVKSHCKKLATFLAQTQRELEEGPV